MGAFKTAEEEGALFYYEVSVGEVLIIREINESLTANKIEKLVAINGTTNYILTKWLLKV